MWGKGYLSKIGQLLAKLKYNPVGVELQVSFRKYATLTMRKTVRKQSQQMLFGVPLVDIAFGPNLQTGERYGRARGFIAIGDQAKGCIAVGGAAYGFIAIGGSAVGVVALGGASFGVLALGGLALGAVALGGFAAGIIARGGLSFASSTSHIAGFICALPYLLRQF